MCYIPRSRNILLILAIMLFLIPACGGDDDSPTTPTTPTDTTAPAQVVDLDFTVTDNSVTLTWTGPTDSKHAKALASYCLRYTTDETELTDETWSEATEVEEMCEPAAGEPQEFTVTDLNWDWVYHFGLKCRDTAGNWSDLSNVVTAAIPEATPDVTAPAAVTTLTAHIAPPSSETSIYLTWTAPGDNGDRGTATEYLLKWANEPLTELNWDGADSKTVSVGGPAGTNESATVTDLQADTRYFFRLVTADEVPNWSDLSNQVSEETWPEELMKITALANTEDSPTWSPEGNEIVYRTVASQFIAHLWLIDAWGEGAPDQLTTGDVFCAEPAWSHNDDIAYQDNSDGDREIYVFPVVGAWPGEAVNLTNNDLWDSSPAWSPDGQQVAFSTQGGVLANKSIWIGSVSLWDPDFITSGDDREDYPAWSPDGTRIAFQSDSSEDNELWVIDLGTSGLTQLTDSPLLDTDPTWSPDGQWIAFYSLRSGNEDLWIIPAGGGTAVQLTSDMGKDIDPDWSPNGRKIAFASDRDGNFDLWVMRVPQWAWPAD